MPRLTARDFAAFQTRVSKLVAFIDEALKVKGDPDLKPKDVMVTISHVVVELSSAFDFGDEIRNRIHPGLILQTLKANTPIAIRDARDAAFGMLQQMRTFIMNKSAQLEEEMHGK